jgi:hypothetical protein
MLAIVETIASYRFPHVAPAFRLAALTPPLRAAVG